MAIYQDESELSTQASRVQFRPMTGFKKGLAGVFGYNSKGERSGFGKFMDAIKPMDYSLGSRFVAKKAASGTDAETVMDETYDEYKTSKLASANLAKDVALAVTSAGAGGGSMGSSGSVQAGSGAGMQSTASAEAVRPGLSTMGGEGFLGPAGDAARGGTGLLSDTEQSVVDMREGARQADTTARIESDINNTDISEIIGNEDGMGRLSNSDSWKKEMGVDTDNLEDLGKLKKEVDKKEEEDSKSKKKTEKDLLSMIGTGGKLADSTIKRYAASSAYHKAGEDEVKNLLKRTRKKTKSYL